MIHSNAPHADALRPLERIDAAALAALAERGTSRDLSRIGPAAIRLEVLQGEDPWRPAREAFVFVVEGLLVIEAQDGETLELRPKQGAPIPEGLTLRTRAPIKTTVLMVERALDLPDAAHS